ncbi:MAG: alpha/beta hydrolase [Rhodospirillales bacterium]|nr:alpha/beta hydrolase [Rhodospirillales bacterium]
MRLEVISRKPKGRARPVPLVFVHGAYSAAWIWDEHFLPYFSDRGWEAHAVSLRGHGGSEGAADVLFARLRDYVADVEEVVSGLSVPPVLIGHSLGGMVVQKCLHRMSFPAAVLMASAPPHGVVSMVYGMAFTNPALLGELTWCQVMGEYAGDGNAIRHALFSDDTPDDVVRRYLPRFQPESVLVNLDLLGLDLPPSTPMLDVPVLVMGVENDQFIYRGALDATASTYRTKAEVFSGMAHAMMLEPQWERPAARIAEWLDAMIGASATGLRMRA